LSKRHHEECIESFLLRLKINIIVLKLNKSTIDDNLEKILNSSKECSMQKLVMKIKQPQPENDTESENSEDDSDEEFFAFIPT
jgi:hypothetical protein